MTVAGTAAVVYAVLWVACAAVVTAWIFLERVGGWGRDEDEHTHGDEVLHMDGDEAEMWIARDRARFGLWIRAQLGWWISYRLDGRQVRRWRLTSWGARRTVRRLSTS